MVIEQERPKNRSSFFLWICVLGCIAFNLFQIITTQSRLLLSDAVSSKQEAGEDGHEVVKALTTSATGKSKSTTFNSMTNADRLPDKANAPRLRARTSLQVTDDAILAPICGFRDVNAVQSKPKEFFENGNGYPFLQNIADNKKKLRRNYITFNGKSLDGTKDCSRVYFHVHKVGGTTISRIPNSEKLYAADIGEHGWDFFHQKLQKVADNVNDLQSNDPDSVYYFTFVRDPVARFVSGVGQVLVLNHLYGSNATTDCINQATPTMFDKNRPSGFDDDTSMKATISLMDCVIDVISEQKFFLDYHLMPQAYEIYDSMTGYDLTINIMEMNESISTVRTQLGGVKSGKDAQVIPGDPKVSHPQFMMSIDILPPRLIKKICRLYHVDVLYLNSLRTIDNDYKPLVNTICNDYDY